MAEVDLADIQGFILRGYTMPAVRHFLLRVGDGAAARRFLGGLVSGDEAASPQLTTAQGWAVKPDYCLNVALTFDGLKALGLPAATLSSFPAEFQAGSASRAESVGDTGPSAPALWEPPFNSTAVHVILSLYAAGRDVLEARTAVLKALFERDGGMAETGRRDGYELPDGKVHFGYQDGISQPNIDGAPGRKVTDMQPTSPTGAFLLGYPSQFVDFTYPVPQPVELGRNGSFVAFRVLQQDCAGFERFLTENAPKVGMGPEKLAAKLCGRWRNGVPIELSPTPIRRSRRSPARSTTISITWCRRTTRTVSTTARGTAVRSAPTCGATTRAASGWRGTTAASTGSSGGGSPTGPPSIPIVRTTASSAGCSACSSASACWTSSSS